MKRKATKEITICDKCGKEASLPQSCDTCGRDVCWDCRDEELAVYPHSVLFSGSNDGYYCRACDAKHRASGGDSRWNAYQAIRALRIEQDRWHEDFKTRREDAEARLQRLLG